MPLAFFHEVQGVLWPEADKPHDILSAAEIEAIVTNYKEGGSVRELAKQFWQAQEKIRASECTCKSSHVSRSSSRARFGIISCCLGLQGEPLTPVKEKGPNTKKPRDPSEP
ncbi:unnamed protein product [Symbiodinium sp. CCMP2592]|nr:unnamed protein product [Symbiodinium sp. CCMP2592]